MQMSRKMNTQIIVTVTNQSIHTTIGVVGTDTLTHTFKFVPTFSSCQEKNQLKVFYLRSRLIRKLEE